MTSSKTHDYPIKISPLEHFSDGAYYVDFSVHHGKEYPLRLLGPDGCFGNPRRFHSQDVVRMEPGSKSRSRPIDGPLEEIETAGQQQLQAILHKQLDTNVTVKQQLAQKRDFSQGVEYNQDTEELAGVRSLGDYKTQGEVDAYIEEMKSYGLTLEEALYKMQSEDQSLAGKKSRLSNPEFHAAKLQEINSKIENKKQELRQQDQFSNVKTLSRHEMDLEKAIATVNPQNKFLHSTLIQQNSSRFSSSNSIITAIVQNSLKTVNQKTVEQSSSMTNETAYSIHSKKHKDCGYKAVCLLECCVPVLSCDHACGSCDSIDKSCDHEHTVCDCQLTVATCMEKPADYVSKDEIAKEIKEKKNLPVKTTSFIVKTGNIETSSVFQCGRDFDDSKAEETEDSDFYREIDFVEPVPEDAIRRYKLSAEEVKKIPKFANHNPGEPNNVLFLKNLAAKVTEEDLASLFIGFQTSDRIVFKLLNGKMKGQAFVTFPNIEIASKAMELVHGYEFKGKPVVIQYGRRQKSTAKT